MTATVHAEAPLYDELAGGLLNTGIPYDSIRSLLHTPALLHLLIPRCLLHCKVWLKCRPAHHAGSSPVTSPCHHPFVAYLKNQVAENREAFVFTASSHTLAERVVTDPGISPADINSDDLTNAAREHKLEPNLRHVGAILFGLWLILRWIPCSSILARIIPVRQKISRNEMHDDSLVFVMHGIGGRLASTTCVMVEMPSPTDHQRISQ